VIPLTPSTKESSVEIGGVFRDAPSGNKRRGLPQRQVVDATVSRAKFGREVKALLRHEAEYRQQGWFLLSAVFPEVFLILTAPQLRPAPVLFGVVLNFENYDVDPASVRFVNPWTAQLLRARELLTPLPKLVLRPANPEPVTPVGEPAATVVAGEVPSPGMAEVAGAGIPSGQPQLADAGRLLQWWTPDSVPFLCMRGVREYHRHPAHTGDSWLIHRKRGEGTLATILAAIHDNGRMPIRDFLYGFNVQAEALQHDGFAQRVSVRVNGLLNVLSDGRVVAWPFQ
jgi:hypothetical protein